MAKKKQHNLKVAKLDEGYGDVLSAMVDLLEESRQTSARAVNSIMTATYWEIGRRIVELEQAGEGRAEYGSELVKRLASDLSRQFGRGFSGQNIYRMRSFFLAYPEILSTVSRISLDEKFSTLSRILPTPLAKSSTDIAQPPSDKLQTVSVEPQITRSNDFTAIQAIANVFPLPWSHYVKLLSLDDKNARKFYEDEALRGGWSVRQLDRQIGSKFYERTLLSKNKATMLQKGTEPQPDDLVTPEEQIKDPFVLEFLGLKDEYSEHDLEDALIHKLEDYRTKSWPANTNWPCRTKSCSKKNSKRQNTPSKTEN